MYIKKVKWKVDKSGIVKITKKSGKNKNKIRIKALSKGKTTIRAKCGNKKYTIKVSVLLKNQAQEDSNKSGEQSTDVQTVKSESLISAQVMDNEITRGDLLKIQLSVSGINDTDTFSYQVSPGTLSVYKFFVKTPVWENLNKKSDYIENGIKYNKAKGNEKVVLSIPLDTYFEGVGAGQYRYTFMIENKEITVEFTVKDVVQVLGEVVNSPLSIGEDLNVRYTISGKGDNEFSSIGHNPGVLERFEENNWVELQTQNFSTIDSDRVIIGSTIFTDQINLNTYYIGVVTGHYKYTYKVGDISVPLEFDIQ